MGEFGWKGYEGLVVNYDIVHRFHCHGFVANHVGWTGVKQLKF